MIGTRTFLHLDALRNDELAQLLDLLAQLANDLRVGVLVDDRLADDRLGAVRISVGIIDLCITLATVPFSNVESGTHRNVLSVSS